MFKRRPGTRVPVHDRRAPVHTRRSPRPSRFGDPKRRSRRDYVSPDAGAFENRPLKTLLVPRACRILSGEASCYHAPLKLCELTGRNFIMVIAMSINLCVTFCGGPAREPPCSPGRRIWRTDSGRARPLWQQEDRPRFTDDFVLADVVLSRSTRAGSITSGDISGRFLGSVSMLPNPEQAARLEASWMDREASETGRLRRHHEPVVRGVGHRAGETRRCVGERPSVDGADGILQYSGSQKALDCATRRFSIGVYETCSGPVWRNGSKASRARFHLFHPNSSKGWTCSPERPATTGISTPQNKSALTEPRGVQHTHGYLTTRAATSCSANRPATRPFSPGGSSRGRFLRGFFSSTAGFSILRDEI